jgi:hypothetical protein
MKQLRTMKQLLTIAALSGSLASLNSCGTISYAMKKGKAPVFMIDGPSDLQVTSGGKPVEMSSEVFAASSNIGGTVTTSYYTKAAMMPHKRKATLDLYSPSMNKHASITVKPKVSGKLIFLDIILGGVGLPIDLATGNATVLKKRLVDVKSTLEGSPSRSQGKLKRMTKRKIKHS